MPRKQRGGGRGYPSMGLMLELAKRQQRGSGLASSLASAIAPTAKDIATQAAIEAAKLGMHKLTNKLGITKKRPKQTRQRKTTGGKRKRKSKRRTPRNQQGGLFPLAALIPAAIAASKAIGLGALGGAAGYGVKRGLRELG